MSVATTAVEHPTLPAVCTRSIGLPAAPSASAMNSSGCITPSKRSGALPNTDRVDVGPVEAGVVERALRGLAHEPRHRDVGARLLVLRLAGADDAGR